MKIIWVYRVRVDQHTHITTWRETYRHLKDRHEIHYVFPYERERVGFGADIEFVSTLPWPYLKRLSLVFNGWRAFVRLDRKLSPQLVILDHWSFFYPLIYLFRRSRPKIILDVRTPEYNKKPGRPGLVDALLKWYSKFVLVCNRRFHDGLTLISSEMGRQLQRDLSVDLHPNLHVWPSGVDPEMFKPRPRAAFATGSELRLVFHGSLTDNRGLSETVEAIGILAARSVAVRLILAGEGAELARLQEAAERHEVADRVEFLGPRPYAEVPEIIAGADVAIMAYPRIDYWEANVPLKILEYMAMEVPVLCTDLRVFRRMTEQRGFARIIPDNRPETIAQGIEWARANLDSLRSAAPEGRELVLLNYSWKAIADGLDEFFSRVVG